MGGRSRTFVNLVTIILASSVLALYALTQLVAGAIFGQGYPLFINLPEAGGLTENKQVTYQGVGVGTIADVELEGEGVRVELEIDQGVQIPRELDVVVLRQSAIGEQAIDFRPRQRVTSSTSFYEPDEDVEYGDLVLPTKPEDLLVLADSVFGDVDNENAALVISELADVVQGRSADIQSILVNSADFNEAVGANGAEYDRLFAASRVVNASLAQNRDALASLITDLADGAQLIGEIRGDVDSLLDTVPSTLATTTSVLERADSNLFCVVRDLADLNTYVGSEPHIDDLAETLRNQAYFFEAFRIIGPTSAQGDPWLRVHFISESDPVANRYEPKRPIQPILPGGACESVFGPGAGSAVQPSFEPVIPGNPVIRPTNDRRPGVAVVAPGGTSPVPSIPTVGIASRTRLPAEDG